MKYLDKLVNESIDVEGGRDELIKVSAKTSSKIYTKLVGIQPTTQPIATVFGIKQKVDGIDPFTSHVQADVDGAMDLSETGTYMTGDKIKSEGVIVEALEPFGPDNADLTSIYSLIMTGKVRVLNDVPEQARIQESNIEISRWRTKVGSRLIRFDASMEMLHDLESQFVDSESVVYDVIGNVVSEQVNSEIILKLIALAKKEKDISLINYETSYYRGRELIIKIAELVADIKKNNAMPTFVLCTPKVEAQLKASGQVSGNIIDGLDLEIVVDVKTPVDYLLVGCASDERLAPCSLYYSPLVESEGDSEGKMTMLFTREVLNMQPSYGANIRYGLSVSNIDDVEGGKVVEIDWSKLANKSLYTSLVRVLL
ncbi:hypothetical protein [Aeromonas hydrophila]|uniref:hypothetical protein n=1 Tax=Aeromonas hydrophila TaxID=644 RepID=UPI000C34ACD1|nr:hypothetical protein [Aeromonas hydrophila]PKD25075.1 hypothetical protein AO056_01557 [Aeromonas hydrophila]